jgi:hypothetical protein
MKSIKQLYKSILNEELIDSFTVGKKEVEIYKNPKIIKNFDNHVRLISTPTGDLYICDYDNFLHQELAKRLIKTNIEPNMPDFLSRTSLMKGLKQGYIC